MLSFAIVIRRAFFEAQKRRKYAKRDLVNRSAILGNIFYFERTR